MMIYHERFKLRHVNNLLHDELHFLLRLLWDILGCSATSQFLTLFHWVVWILLVSVMQNPLWKRNKHTKKTLLNIGRQNPPQTSRCELKLTIIKPKPLKINYPGQTKRIFKSWKISTNKSPYISLNNWLREFASSNDFQKSHIYFYWLCTEIFWAKLMLDTFGTKRLNAPMKPQECLRANKSTVVK